MMMTSAAMGKVWLGRGRRCSFGGVMATGRKSGRDETVRDRGGASWSTSQAVNASDVVECGGTALSVDEDMLAAIFFSRYGMMRAMIANETVTPQM